MPSTINHRIVRDELYSHIHQLALKGVGISQFWEAEIRLADLNCGIYNDKTSTQRYEDWKKEKGI